MRALPRLTSVAGLPATLLVSLAVFTSGALLPGCFGDNSDDAGPGVNKDGPSIVEISSPDGVDQAASVDVEIRVKGKPAEQLSVAIDATLGTFATASKVVITDAAGEGTWTTTYLAGDTSGADTLTVNVSDLAAQGNSSTKPLTVYGVERLGNLTPVGAATAQSSGVLVAYPMVLATARVVTKLGIVAPSQFPPAPVRVQLGLYTTASATSVSVLAKTTAELNAGTNEISISPQALEAGTYWMVVAYEGSPDVYRSTVNVVSMRYKVTHVFADGLDDTISGLSTSAVDLGDSAALYPPVSG